MNIVGIYKGNGKIFEAQSYADNEQKSKIENAIREDAISAGIEIEIRIMTDAELKALM